MVLVGLFMVLIVPASFGPDGGVGIPLKMLTFFTEFAFFKVPSRHCANHLSDGHENRFLERTASASRPPKTFREDFRWSTTIRTLPMPTEAEVTRQLNTLRNGLRVLTTTIRKLENKQTADTGAILRRLAVMRMEAEGVLDTAKKTAAAA
jgi:hypothetical protein